MSNTNTGGSAFPYTSKAQAVSKGDGGGANYEIQSEGGMTLRDYFAAYAMQGDIIAGLHQDAFEITAKRAYRMADAMLKAREEV